MLSFQEHTSIFAPWLVPLSKRCELSRPSTPRSSTRLLYFFPKKSEFIAKDLEALADHFELHPNELKTNSRILLPWRLLVQFLFLIRMRAWRHDAICHFAGYHSVLPSLLCRRCFIILAGSDAACFPNIDYGNFRKAAYAAATTLSVRRATRLLPVDESLMGCEQRYDTTAPSQQGLRAFVKDLTTPWTVIHYGFDPTKWHPPLRTHRIKTLFVCVASGASPGNQVHHRKGIDLLIEAAKALPSAHIVVAGCNDPGEYADVPPNLEMRARLDATQLIDLFGSATYYLQVSMMEGFPNALCEAMLCGCVPIVSSMAAMPAIVGRVGHIVARRSSQDLAETMRTALNETPHQIAERSIGARMRIMSDYQNATRISALIGLLEEG